MIGSCDGVVDLEVCAVDPQRDGWRGRRLERKRARERAVQGADFRRFGPGRSGFEISGLTSMAFGSGFRVSGFGLRGVVSKLQQPEVNYLPLFQEWRLT